MGAAQAAIAELEQSGAVALIRGPRGSVLEGVSLHKLWAVTEQVPFVMSMPIPANLRSQGLATGVKDALRRAEFDSYLSFVRGSRTRLRSLQNGFSRVAAMSAFAARQITGPSERVYSLPAGTFALERRVFQRDTLPKRRLRVAVDKDSADLQQLTNLEFSGQPFDAVPAVYIQFLQLLADGEVDAAVWDLDETTALLPPGIVSRPLSPKVIEAVGDNSTAVSFVLQEDDRAARQVVESILLTEETVAVQQDVLAHLRAPDF